MSKGCGRGGTGQSWVRVADFVPVRHLLFRYGIKYGTAVRWKKAWFEGTNWGSIGQGMAWRTNSPVASLEMRVASMFSEAAKPTLAHKRVRRRKREEKNSGVRTPNGQRGGGDGRE